MMRLSHEGSPGTPGAPKRRYGGMVPVAVIMTALAGFAVIAAMPLRAMEWPSAPGAPAAGFGTPERGYLSAGIILGASPESVRAAADGELLYLRGTEGLLAGVPPVSGGLVALAHSNGFVTVYSGIQPLVRSVSGQVRQGTVIGVQATGISGDPRGPGFAIEDRPAKSWVNPLVVLPRTSAAGELIPMIPAITLYPARSRDATQAQELAANAKEPASLKGGAYEVHARFLHPARKGMLLAPYRARLMVNGIEQVSRSFDAAMGGTEGLSFAGMDSPSRSIVDAEGRIRLGAVFLPDGEIRVKVVLESIEGNTRETVLRLRVR